MGFNFLEIYVRYRVYLSILMIAGGIYWGMSDSWSFAWILLTAGIIIFLAHFLLGPIRLLQKTVESGDIAKAQRILETVKYPNLLIKPVRSVFYFIQSNMAISQKDFGRAEDLIKKSTDLGMPMNDMNGMALFQHGSIAFQKGDNKMAITKLREAISTGLADNDSLAGAHMMLCSIFIQRKENRIAKVHFKKAKEAKPKAKEIVDQINQMNSYISRIPG